MTEKNIAKICEMFTSVQGEGPYVGCKQLFIRFCGCNLNCDYCDTTEFKNAVFNFTPVELNNYIQKFGLETIHSVSLTGGEPLLWSDFLLEFLPLLENKIYLETNSTLGEAFAKIADYVDVISADIKLPSSSGVKNSFSLHDEFFRVARKFDTEIFAKIVFDENILDDEIANCINLAKKYDLPIVLQPKTENEQMSLNYDSILTVFDKFLDNYKNVRVIPQVHKYLQAP
jgi:organic radical activating enzyme